LSRCSCADKVKDHAIGSNPTGQQHRSPVTKLPGTVAVPTLMITISVAPALIVIVAFVPVAIEGRAMALTPAPAEIVVARVILM